MGELTHVVKPCTEAPPTCDDEAAWGGARTSLKVRNHPHSPHAPSGCGGSSMATKSIGMHTQHDDMMCELTRVLKRRGAAEAIEDRRCNLTKDAAEAAATARAKAEAKAKAEAAVRARCQPVQIFAQEAAVVALQQSEEEISPTQTIKGNPQTKSYFESLPPPAARRALDLSTTVGVGQGGRMLGGSPKPAFLTELQQVLQKGSHESTEGGGGTSGAQAERAESKSASSTNTPAAASAEAKGRALRSAPGPMPAPARGMQDLMDELTRVLKQRGAADTTVAETAAATTVTRRPSFGRKKRPGQGEAAAGGLPVLALHGRAPSTAEPPPPATAVTPATAATAAVLTRRLSFGRKAKAKEEQPSAQVDIAEPDSAPMAPDEPSTADEPTPPATTAPTRAATARAAAVLTRRLSFDRKTKAKEKQSSGHVATAEPDAVPVASDEPSTAEPIRPATTATTEVPTLAATAAAAAGVTVGAAKVATASAKVHQIDAFLNRCQARYAEASCVARLAMIEEDSEPDEKEEVPVDPDEPSATEPPLPRQESFSRAAARAAAAARRKAAVAAAATTAVTASAVASLERKKRPAPLATKLEARRLTIELESCQENGLGLGLDAFNRITEMKPAGQAAASRKLLLGDVVVSVNGTALEGRQLQHVLRPGVALTLEVERGGRGFHRMRQLSFERKSAKQKRDEAEMRKEAAEAEAEKVVDVTNDRGDEGGASGGTPCVLFDEHGSAIPTASVTRGGDQLPAAPSSATAVCLSALSRARQYAAQHRLPAASMAVTLTARRPSPPSTKRSPWVAATAATLVRVPSFGRKKLPAGRGETTPTGEDDGLDEDLAV